jgi:hypothetical protein
MYSQGFAPVRWIEFTSIPAAQNALFFDEFFQKKGKFAPQVLCVYLFENV